MSEAPGLSVVLPTLDEAAGLRVLLPRLKALFERLGVRGEVLVIDGGSRDETTAVAAEHGARVLRQKGRGFGSAVREGLQAAGAEWVALMDADGSHAPEALERFWARRQEARLIVGSRYCRGGSAEMPLLRQVLSRALNFVSKRVLDLPVHESSSGFRLYHGPSARAVPSVATDFSVQQDLLVGILAAGGRVVEEPIHYAPRVGGASKANAWRLAPAYIRLLLRLKPQRGGWRAEAGLFAVLTLGLLTGLCGITGGLPGRARWRALPEELRGSPAFARGLADSWTRLYQEIKLSHKEMRADEPRTSVQGELRVAPGWAFPPDGLVNAARALLTQSVNPDEKKSFIILAQMRPWRLDFQPLYVQYGGGFIYPLGAFLGAAHVLQLVRLTPDLAYYLADPDQMGRLYLLGRLYILLFHLGTVWVLYELGRALSGPRAGTIAALLFALAPFVVVQSHVIKPHPVAAFWFVLAAHLMVRAVEESRPEDFLACGLAAGLAAGTNLTLLFALGAPLLACLLGRRGGWKWALGASALGLAVAAACNPYLIAAPRDFAWELTIYAPTRFGLGAGFLPDLIRRGLPRGMGGVCAALLSVSCAAGLFSRDPRRRALAVLIAVGSVLLWLRLASTGEESILRVFYGPFAAACALGGALLCSAAPALAAVVLAAALAESGLRSAAYLVNFSADAGPRDTRTRAADWIDARVPAGASLGLMRLPEPAHTPSFRWDRLNLVVLESTGALRGAAPDWLVVEDRAVGAQAAWVDARYTTAATFPPIAVPGTLLSDDSFFSNVAISVLKSRAKP